jgi:hypothetical protein
MRHGESPLHLLVRTNNSTLFMNFWDDKLIEPDQALHQTKDLKWGTSLKSNLRSGSLKGGAR